ncbi:MAG TPA: sulfatase-like hydrolase/transferase, partial [Caulifigura sp.]|nr:sulfatase-like hydrolase/transferase [Caulifigura sp.]
MLRSLLLIILTFVSLSIARADQPNILLIVADDLGWRDVGWHGGPFATPNLDKLVKEGVELDRHYVQPVCSPTRTALLSGRWTGRFGPHALSPTNRRVFPLGTVTLASALKEAGYSTHMAGKWHLGSRPEWGPQHYGFDQSYGSLNGAVDPWTHKYRNGPYLDTWHRNGQILSEEGNATELVAAQSERWIRESKKPWFVYVPFHAVHIPIDTPEEYTAPYANSNFDPDPEKNASRRRFGAFVSQLDAKVAQLVKAIDETSQRANTLIVFTSDNGGLEKGGNAYVGNVPGTPALSSNLPLRGWKNQLYEGGIRVPAFVNWPAKLKPRKLDAPMHVADWMPTLTALAGWKKPEAQIFDGRTNGPLITGNEKEPASRA